MSLGFNGYLLLFGFALMLAGVVVAASSIGMLSGYSSISDATMTLLLGSILAVAGALLLLVGVLPTKRRRSMYY